MLKQGVKRKASLRRRAASNANKSPLKVKEEANKRDYARNLNNFQIASRKRESLRIKNAILLSATPQALQRQVKEKITVEMSVVEGTAKFIMASKAHSAARLEAAKSLQAARLRLDMLNYELARLRRGRASPVKANASSYASLSLSDLRIPLVKASTAVEEASFAVFAVARMGSQIYDSSLVWPVNTAQDPDITFPDVLLFNKVAPHFEVILEIYAHKLEAKHANTPAKLARSIGRAVGKSMAKKDFESVGPKFHLVATAELDLENCGQEVQTAELTKLDSPLQFFDQFCFRLAALPYCCEEEVVSGALELLAMQTRTRLWASLSNWRLSLWTDKSLKDAGRRAYLIIDVTRESAISDRGKDTLTITNRGRPWTFVFEEEENLHHWLVHLLQHAADHRRWKQAAVERMTVYSPTKATQSGESSGSRTMKRTKSHLVRIYNQAGQDGDENAESARLV